jgi:hypothetical protein
MGPSSRHFYWPRPPGPSLMTALTFGVVLSPEHLKMARDDALLSNDRRRQNGMAESPAAP